MTNMTLEQRVESLERAVLELRAGGTTGPSLVQRLATAPPLSGEEQLALEEMAAYGRYYRQTGKEAPPDWKPGDPIPEPDEEWCPR
jgi:hypothetical protein